MLPRGLGPIVMASRPLRRHGPSKGHMRTCRLATLVSAGGIVLPFSGCSAAAVAPSTTAAPASMTQPPSILVVVSSRVARGTSPDDGPATDLRHGANARR